MIYINKQGLRRTGNLDAQLWEIQRLIDIGHPSPKYEGRAYRSECMYKYSTFEFFLEKLSYR